MEGYSRPVSMCCRGRVFTQTTALPEITATVPLHRRGGLGLPLVHVKEDESFENALRRFKRKCEKSGILSELKKRQHYEKPSMKRKRKAIAARKKVLRKLAEERRTGY